MNDLLNRSMRFASAMRCCRLRASVLCVMALSLLTGQIFAQQQTQGDKPGAPVVSNQTDEIKQMESYYVEMYSEPLRAKGRLPKLLAIMSLSKILGDKTSSSVFELVANKDPVVGYLAWEVLHARHTHLKPELQLAWAQAGVERGADGELPGTTLAAPLLAAAAHPPTEFAKYRTKIIDRVIENYKPTVEQDVPVLDAARVLVASWRDPAMLTRLKGKLSDDTTGAAAWYILEPLAKSIAKADALETVAQRRTAIDAWQKSPEGKYDPSGLTPYKTLGQMLPEPKQITDPNAEE